MQARLSNLFVIIFIGFLSQYIIPHAYLVKNKYHFVDLKILTLIFLQCCNTMLLQYIKLYPCILLKISPSIIEVMHKAWLRAITSFFSVIYRVSSWNEWLRAGALYDNLTHGTVIAFLGQICALVQQTD